MTTSKEYLQFPLDQLFLLEEIDYCLMMGEHIIYYQGKSQRIFATIGSW